MYNQAQNEALVRLMLAAQYADHKLTLSEDDEFQKQLNELAWESGTELDIFVQEATAIVRKALATEETKQRFLTAQCSQFSDPEAKRSVVDRIQRVLQADGIDTEESSLLQQIRGLLQI
jgi:uncharacterized tellurite resistance protein B-like protein